MQTKILFGATARTRCASLFPCVLQRNQQVGHNLRHDSMNSSSFWLLVFLLMFFPPLVSTARAADGIQFISDKKLWVVQAGDESYAFGVRSEERRVGKECRCGWGRGDYKKKVCKSNRNRRRW